VKIFKSVLALSVLLALLAACGDESSSSAPDPIGEISSSSNDDNGSSGKDKDASSSSQKDSKKSSSSVAEKNSSSSVSGKNSSSSVPNPVSSSEESFSGTPCEKDEEGYTVFISQEQVKYICQNGFWIPMSSSSVVQQSSSSKYYDMSRQFNAKLSYGEFTDPRDNRVYKTIRFRVPFVTDSVEFFAENLNFGKMISGGNQQGDSTKYCYDDDPWYCENGWGGLYTWATAMAFSAACDSNSMGSSLCPDTIDLTKNQIEEMKGNPDCVFHQGVCPVGWHIMNREEWASVISGSSIMNPSGYLSSEVWNGLLENPTGFSLLPAGALDEHGEFSEIMNQAFHWLPEDSYDKSSGLSKGAFTRATSFNLYRGSGNGFVKTAGFSIRCVKDY
jgi:uncharacterized protein (TIGR02145 family)